MLEEISSSMPERHLRVDNNDLERKDRERPSVSGCTRLSVSRISIIRSEFPVGDRFRRMENRGTTEQQGGRNSLYTYVRHDRGRTRWARI